MTPGSPVPDAVATELERVGQRWQQLPLAHALRHAPALRALAGGLADAVADHEHRERLALPDLGPAAAYDQLVVTTYDFCSAGLTTEGLPEQLAALRRTLE